MIRIASISALLLLSALLPGNILGKTDRGDGKPANLPPAPPIPVPQVVKVGRGEKAEIPLRIYGSQKDELRFLIRTSPEHGKLSAPAPTGREAATVVYEAPADLAVTRERFTYAAKNTLGVSAPADVQITIIDKPPSLRAPQAADFPAILAGTMATQTIELANEGGGMAEGELEVDAPWRIEGNSKYHLAAGAKHSFLIRFAPERAGTFQSEVRYSSQRDRFTLLSGKAEAPLVVEPSSLDLHNAPGDPVREASFEILNNSEQEIEVALEGVERLEFPQSVSVPAKARLAVTVRTPKADVDDLQGELQLNGAGMGLRVPVRGPAAGPVLRSLQESLRFGPAAVGAGGAATAAVENLGGSIGSWKCEITSPFKIADSKLQLAPGEKRMITVRIDAGEPGRYDGGLKITGEQQAVDIPVAAVITGAQASLLPASNPMAAPSPMPVTSQASISSALPAASEPGEGTLPSEQNRPAWMNATVAERGPTYAILTWPTAASAATQYKLEDRVLALDAKHSLKTDWVQVPATSTRVENNKVVAEVRGLKPHSPHTIRVSPVEPGGITGAPLFMLQFTTADAFSPFRLTASRLLLIALCLAAAIFGWNRFRQRRA